MILVFSCIITVLLRILCFMFLVCSLCVGYYCVVLYVFWRAFVAS